MAAGELWVQSTALRWHAGGATIGSSVGTDDGGDAGVDGHLWIETTKIGYIDDNTDPRMIEGNPYCAVYCSTDDDTVNEGENTTYDGSEKGGEDGEAYGIQCPTNHVDCGSYLYPGCGTDLSDVSGENSSYRNGDLSQVFFLT